MQIMDFLRNMLIGLFLFLATLNYAQTETEKVIQTIIEFEQDLNENKVIVSESLESFGDTSFTNSFIDEFGEFKEEDFKNIQFGSLNVRLISKNALLKLKKIASKLNSLTNDNDEIFPITYYQLVNEIFDRDLCTFSKVLFTKDKKYALVKYSVVTGNSLGLGDFSSTFLMEQKKEKWLIKEILESEI